MYRRRLFDFISSHHYSILILGPRQTGKSTLLHQMKPDLAINLADENTFLEFSSDPGCLGDRLFEKNGVSILPLRSALEQIADFIG